MSKTRVVAFHGRCWPVCADEVEGNGALQLILPLILAFYYEQGILGRKARLLFEVDAEVRHLLWPQEVAIPGVCDVVEPEDLTSSLTATLQILDHDQVLHPVSFAHVRVFQDDFPCVVSRIVQRIIQIS